jgi:hypothetical protein
MKMQHPILTITIACLLATGCASVPDSKDFETKASENKQTPRLVADHILFEYKYTENSEEQTEFAAKYGPHLQKYAEKIFQDAGILGGTGVSDKKIKITIVHERERRYPVFYVLSMLTGGVVPATRDHKIRAEVALEEPDRRPFDLPSQDSAVFAAVFAGLYSGPSKDKKSDTTFYYGYTEVQTIPILGIVADWSARDRSVWENVFKRIAIDLIQYYTPQEPKKEG